LVVAETVSVEVADGALLVSVTLDGFSVIVGMLAEVELTAFVSGTVVGNPEKPVTLIVEESWEPAMTDKNPRLEAMVNP
jgi:hypothetical protein